MDKFSQTTQPVFSTHLFDLMLTLQSLQIPFWLRRCLLNRCCSSLEFVFHKVRKPHSKVVYTVWQCYHPVNSQPQFSNLSKNKQSRLSKPLRQQGLESW